MMHRYVCVNTKNGEILKCEKLPPILKALRIETGYTFKVPHGNKVRTFILEEGACVIYNGDTDTKYIVTIERDDIVTIKRDNVRR